MKPPMVPPVLSFPKAVRLVLRQAWAFCGDAYNVLRCAARGRPPHSLCVVATLKNEAPYIREWIEYHRIVGVEKFFLYDNESDDDLRSVLESYMRAGIVELVPWAGRAQQLAIYADAFRRYGHQTKWMAVIDADEFLFPVFHDSVPKVLEEYETHAGVTANWMMFDSGGHETKPGGLVVESYRRRLPPVTAAACHVKTVCKPAYTRAFMNPHIPAMRLGRHLVNQAREPMLCPFNYVPAGTEKLQVFHYWTKSREEFLAKLSRGRVMSAAIDAAKILDMLNFEHYEIESGMDRFIPELKRRLALEPSANPGGPPR